MKCVRSFSFVLFALLGVFFGSFIITQNNTFAIADLVYTYDPTSTSITTFCSSSTSTPDCDDYEYIYITPSEAIPYCMVTLRYGPLAGSMRSAPFGFPSSDSFYLLRSDFTSFAPVTSNTYLCSSGYSLPSGFTLTITFTENNPFSSGITPSGSLSITQNGTYDVTNYAEAVVDVPTSSGDSSGGGNYHEDLVAINNSILICAGVCLMIYFFYCIYRMFIKPLGGR